MILLITVIICYIFSLLQNCFEELVIFQKALREVVSSVDPAYAEQHEEFFIGFEGR